MLCLTNTYTKKLKSETASLAVAITVRQLISQEHDILSVLSSSEWPYSYIYCGVTKASQYADKQKNITCIQKIKGRDIKSTVGVEKWC